MPEHTHELIDLSDAGRYGYQSLRHSTAPYRPRYFLDDSRIPSEYGHDLPKPLKDLLDIAAALMWVDRERLRSRRHMGYGVSRGWSRNLRVRIGVRDALLWSRSDVKQQLEGLLFWLTEDVWELDFVPIVGTRRPSDLQAPLFAQDAREHLVVLFSGGLDSLAGVVRLLEQHPEPSVVLVSAVHNRQRLRPVIEGQWRRLQRCYGKERVLWAPLPFHVVERSIGSNVLPETGSSRREEHTQRTRGFLFLVFAAAVASVFRTRHIIICENGVGAINLPMDWCQLGTQNTRGVHPRTLAQMAELLTLIGYGDLMYEAPYTFMTKAELCSVLVDHELQPLIRRTVSCDGFPHRFPNPTADAQLHCGWCTSCLLRRQAIHAAGLAATEVPGYYRRDLCATTGEFRPSDFEPLKKMLDQAHLFERAASTSDPGYALAERFPELLDAALIIGRTPQAFGLAGGEVVLAALADLMVRYARNWRDFPYELRPDLRSVGSSDTVGLPASSESGR